MKKNIQLFLLCLLYLQAQAQENYQFKIDSLLTATHSKGMFNGVALVTNNGKIILQKAYGLSEIDPETPLTINNQFYIGSLTKQFTAVLILQLHEEKILDIYSPISKYLDQFNDSIYQDITIHQLLTHTSGLGSYTSHPNFDRSVDYSDQYMFDLIKTPLLFKPSTNWSYSNSGYYLLGKIAERVSDSDYGTLLNKYIINPLQLVNTGYSTTWLSENVAKGYLRTINGISTMPNYSLITLYSTGGIYSTATDLHKWTEALGGTNLLSESSKQILFQPIKNDYACGQYVKKGIDSDGNKYERHFHGGIIKGYHSFILNRIPQKQIIILLDNCHNQEIQTIKNRIWSVLVDENIREIKPKLSNLLFDACSKGTLIQIIDSISTNTSLFNEIYAFEEFDINVVAYRLMDSERYKEAYAILNFNINQYPNSWNVYDSMGELQLKQGNYIEAKKLYRKSLLLNPENGSARVALKEIELRSKLNKHH